MKRTFPILLLALLVLNPSGVLAATNPFAGCQLLPSVDGRYEFVWKPTGAHRPEAVIVLPSRFTAVTSYLDMYTYDKKRIERTFQKSNGVCPPVGECLRRPTFAAAMPGASYQRKYGSIVLLARTKVNHCFLWKIRKPAFRSD